MSTSHFSKCWLSSSVFNCERDQLCVSLGIKTLVDSPALLGGPTGPRGQQGPWAVGGLSVPSSTALLDSRRGAPFVSSVTVTAETLKEKNIAAEKLLL